MKKGIFHRILSTNLGRKAVLAVFDVFSFFAVDFLYLLIEQRSTSILHIGDLGGHLINALIQLVLIFTFRGIFRVYRNVWRYSNVEAYFALVLADGIAGIMTVAVSRFFGVYTVLWHAITTGALAALVALMARFSYMIYYKRRQKNNATDEKERIPVAIIGAGRLGAYLADELLGSAGSAYKPLFFIDNDRSKIGNLISGIKVYSNEQAEVLISENNIKEVFVTISNQADRDVSKIYYYYRGLGCHVRMYDSLVTGDESPRGVLREFSIEDLLFREPIVINNKMVSDYYGGKTVLITGGGGSIGCELCRQIAKCAPKKLVIFDIYENNAYDIQQELIRKYGNTLSLSVEIGSVRDAARLDDIFARYKPDVVFHAAAHKHVPFMEDSCGEAIKNNVLGTYNAANIAEKYGVKKFILISTDKAVNPTSIMGASKRVCEMIVQCRGDSKTSFAAVRFGNVLGSNGSVIPLFRQQIAEGGPVTVTDKRIQRYFMTIPEASRLVIQAGAMAKKGELFVLNMGNPVKIYDLAEQMIRLSGFEPGKDIEIKEIGLRPGEKLYEELLIKTEKLDKTENNMIFIERDTPFGRDEVEEKLRILCDAVEDWDGGDAAGIKLAMAKVVPTYSAPEQVNSDAIENGILDLQKVNV